LVRLLCLPIEQFEFISVLAHSMAVSQNTKKWLPRLFPEIGYAKQGIVSGSKRVVKWNEHGYLHPVSNTIRSIYLHNLEIRLTQMCLL
jgi:hypothetical protein